MLLAQRTWMQHHLRACACASLFALHGSYIMEALDDLATRLIGAVDVSEQEMMLPTHSIAEGMYLSTMAVDVAARRSGVGRVLLSAAEEGASARGAEGLWLHVERSNDAAIALYESAGYRKQPETARHAAFTAALGLRQQEPMLYYRSL